MKKILTTAALTALLALTGGAAVNSLPISASKFTLPLVYVAYEAISKKSLGDFDSSWSFGLYDLMFIPIGSQPTVSYSEFLAKQHIVTNDGSHGLNFSVFGVLLGFRL